MNEKQNLVGINQRLDSTATEARGIGRRQAVRRLLAGAGGAFVVPGLAAGHPMNKHLADAVTMATAEAKAATPDWTPEFLDPHQNETLTVLAERIIPGSTKAEVSQFIDLLLTVDSQENQKKFLASLGAFEAESRSRFGHPFQALTEDQQNQVLTIASTAKPGDALGKELIPGLSRPSNGSSEPIRITIRDHFDNLKGWISGAYYSSEVGMRELGWTGQVMFESFPGCEHPDGHHAS